MKFLPLLVVIRAIAAAGLNLPFSLPPGITRLVGGPTLPFPQWLTDFTGLKEWPGLDPPFIPLDFIDFSKIEPANHHIQGQCDMITPTSCSFDCQNCVSFDDVYTCPVLSQTFDDGPTPATTKLLANLKTKTTFFVLGHNVAKYPDTYRQAVAAGHIMGSHTWSHKFLPSLSNEEIIAQIQWSIWAMNATGHHLPKWFRPPYGGLDNRVRSIVRQFGMQNVLWDYDTFDWKLNDNSKSAGQVVAEVDQLIKSRTHGLMLEHDMMVQTVNIGIDINKKLPSQMTVPQCIGGIDYIKRFN
ncbi:chitin deacetylase [Yamadazyma tenuis]|nr:chitin deacetylase [Yamadazyma tenuis]